MIQVGEIIKLDDNKEYIVVNTINLHNVNYVYLITNSTPLEVMIAVQKNENGNIKLEEVKSNDELDYILSQLVLNTKEEEID